MDSQGVHVMTIANSIIGVSILAMPYCFKQCGIILSIVMLVFSSVISRLACHFLLKSAIRARLRTFEFLAYHAFGALGKFVIEIGIIGFLLGTCIAFFVVMGDLGPQIVAQMVGISTTSTLRTGILIGLAVFFILPLGLLRNVDSLSGVCTAAIGFYMCLVLKIMAESAPHLLNGDWYDNVEYWRLDGVLQCLPIFSMALFCQTQLFEIYQAIPNASLEKMNNLIRVAVNICTSVYIFVGVFGYIALSNESFRGNILMSFKPSFMTEIMKIGFVLSVAFSFPLIIFPCRASLFSLLYKPTYTLHDSGTNYIPEGKFRLLTVFVVGISLVIGILIPNIELVLGLVGSTIGVMICVLFPATSFICMSKKNTNERILAQIMLFVGIIVMVLGTYANLYAMEEARLNMITERVEIVSIEKIKNIAESDDLFGRITTRKRTEEAGHAAKRQVLIEDDGNLEDNGGESPHSTNFIVSVKPLVLQEIVDDKNEAKVESQREVLKEVRHEPPQPVEPDVAAEGNLKEIPSDEASDGTKQDTKIKNETKQPEHISGDPGGVKIATNVEDSKPNAPTEIVNPEQVDIEAIKKEDKEMKLQEKDKLSLSLIDELQKQNEKQQQLVDEKKKVLEEIKQRQEALKNEQDHKVQEEKLKAVKEIESFAKQAIESLVGDDVKQPNDDVKRPNDDVKRSDDVPDKSKEFFAVPAKAKIDPAPLSYQLRHNENNATSNASAQRPIQIDKTALQSLLPLPIAKSIRANFVPNRNINELNASQSLNAPVKSDEAIDRVEAKLEPNVGIDETVQTKSVRAADVNRQTKSVDEGHKNDDVQAMRREILSDDATRFKRSVNDDDVELEKMCDKTEKNELSESGDSRHIGDVQPNDCDKSADATRNNPADLSRNSDLLDLRTNVIDVKGPDLLKQLLNGGINAHKNKRK